MFNQIADILLIAVEGSAADSGLPAYFTDRNVIRIFLFQQFLVFLPDSFFRWYFMHVII